MHKKNAPTVVICGAGIGGLTAAHELARRGCKVVVYERNDIVGGLARSSYLKRGNKKYPTEYSWRIYGTGYKNLLRVLKEIPLRKDAKKTVFDNLIRVSTYIFPRFNRPAVVFPGAQSSATIKDGFSAGDRRLVMEKIFFCLTMSRERMDSMNSLKWKDFCADMSSDAQKFVVQLWGPILGMDTTRMSFSVVARMVGVLLGGFTGALTGFYLLKKPTNDGWFDEWTNFLEKKRGVVIRTGCEVLDFVLKDNAISGVRVKNIKTGDEYEDRADFTVIAMSVETVAKIVSQNKRLAALQEFKNIIALADNARQVQLSVQIFLDKKPVYPTDKKLVLYLPDTPWALIIEPQALVWGTAYSTDPRVKSVLSVGICQTDWPGILHGKPFVDCTPKEIEDEVWAQILASYEFSGIKNEDGSPLCRGNQILFYMWDSFSFNPKTEKMTVWEPKFSNNADAEQFQPETKTSLQNAVFAAGYAKTDRFIYSMESAVEAGVRAANEIIKKTKIDARPSRIFPLKKTPGILLPLVYLDALLFKAGLPHLGTALKSSIGLVFLYAAALIALIVFIFMQVASGLKS